MSKRLTITMIQTVTTVVTLERTMQKNKIVFLVINYWCEKNWKNCVKCPLASSHVSASNITFHIFGVSGSVRINIPPTPYQPLGLLLDDQIINVVIERINEKITNLVVNYVDTYLSCQFIHHVDRIEMRSFFGKHQIYLAVVFKSSNEDINSLFYHRLY